MNFFPLDISYVFATSVLIGVFYFLLKRILSNRLRCPKCKSINFVWTRKPLKVEETNRGEIYHKKIKEEVGFTETETDGTIWHPGHNGDSSNSYYSGSSISRHFEYKMRPHQIIELREIFSCKACQSKIARRRRREFQIEE
jgi:phage FluMu protein Com